MGGAVRDALLLIEGTLQKDGSWEYDLVSREEDWEKAKEILTASFGKGYEVKDRFLTTRYTGKNGVLVDITVAQGSVEEDLKRRDYSVNALLWRPPTKGGNGLFDPLSFASDVLDKRLVPIHHDSLSNDPLRVLRGLRLIATHDLTATPEIWDAFRHESPNLVATSGERIRHEMAKGFPASPSFGRHLGKSGVLDALFPWEQSRTTPAGILDDFSVEEHAYTVSENFFNTLTDPSSSFPEFTEYFRDWKENTPIPWHWYLGALLHDIGKPITLKLQEGKRTYPQHPQGGERLVENALSDLALSSREKKEVLSLISLHLRVAQISGPTGIPTKKALRRYFKATGALAIPLVLLDLSDAKGYPEPIASEILDPRHHRIHHHILSAAFREPFISHPTPFLTGTDLIEMGWNEGPEVGRVLEKLLDAQVEGKVNSESEARVFVRKHQE